MKMAETGYFQKKPDAFNLSGYRCIKERILQMKKIMVFVTTMFLAVFSVFGLMCNSITPVHAATTSKLIVPAYFYPGEWNTSSKWYTMCNQMPADSIAIMNPSLSPGNSTWWWWWGIAKIESFMNPSSGPGTSRDTNYSTAVTNCQDLNQNVIGYVDTNYGDRPLASVEAEIDKYYLWYGVDGIFLGDMSSDSSFQSYYQDLYSYIHTKGGSLHDLVVGDMGTFPSTDWPLSNGNVVDILVGFEGSYSDYSDFTPPSWINEYPASDFAALVSNTSSSNLNRTCSRLSLMKSGIQYRYVTDAANYTVLPSYWSTETSSC
jgi:hypothetical protein